MATSFEIQSGDAVSKQIFEDRLQFVESVQEGLKILHDESEVSFYWQSSTIDSLKQDTCEYKSIPHFNFEVPMGIMMRKGIPQKEVLNHE